jgi:hypothetical protein
MSRKKKGKGYLSEGELLRSIREVVAEYPNAPSDIAAYTWLFAPRYWDRITVPGGGEIEPRIEDHHAGVTFRVGWSQRDRAVALWIL